jgi:hypothetical protein
MSSALTAMAVHRRQLVLSRDHDLFGIEHAATGGEVAGIAVARGEEEQAGRGEVAAAVVGHIPAKPRFDEAGELGATVTEGAGRQIGEGRQDIAMSADE